MIKPKATKPVLVTKEFTKRRVVRPARYQKRQDGQKVTLPPEYEEYQETKDFWVVSTELDGLLEVHEFSSEEAANNFYGAF